MRAANVRCPAYCCLALLANVAAAAPLHYDRAHLDRTLESNGEDDRLSGDIPSYGSSLAYQSANDITSDDKSLAYQSADDSTTSERNDEDGRALGDITSDGSSLSYQSADGSITSDKRHTTRRRSDLDEPSFDPSRHGLIPDRMAQFQASAQCSSMGSCEPCLQKAESCAWILAPRTANMHCVNKFSLGDGVKFAQALAVGRVISSESSCLPPQKEASELVDYEKQLENKLSAIAEKMDIDFDELDSDSQLLVYLDALKMYAQELPLALEAANDVGAVTIFADVGRHDHQPLKANDCKACRRLHARSGWLHDFLAVDGPEVDQALCQSHTPSLPAKP